MIGRTEWPHLLADLRAKREALDRVIATLEENFVVGTFDESSAPAPANGRAKKAKNGTGRDGTGREQTARQRDTEPP